MIKFTAHRGRRRLVGFGLSRLNVKKLTQGEPIIVLGEELELAGYEIMIFFGETEDRMVADLKKAGLIFDAERTTKH